MVAMGNIEMLAEDNDDFKDKAFLKKIYKELGKIKNIIHKLQNITQIKTKKYLDGEILDIEKSSEL